MWNTFCSTAWSIGVRLKEPDLRYAIKTGVGGGESASRIILTFSTSRSASIYEGVQTAFLGISRGMGLDCIFRHHESDCGANEFIVGITLLLR